MQQSSSRDNEGLALNDLKLVEYNPDWPHRFAEEHERLKHVPHSRAIEHIGSTAIPGMKAKPVIDIAMKVDCSPEDVSIIQALTAVGYRHYGEYGLPGRHFFTLGEPPVVHLHVVGPESSHWANWMAFRNFLIHSPEWRKRYEEMKIKLMAQAHGDRKRYTESKTEIIKHILKAAEGKLP